VQAHGSTGAWATDQDSGGNWQYGASIYLRGAGINSETAASSEVHVSFSDLIIHLNTAFMRAFEARTAQWSSLTDVIVLNVEDSGDGEVPVPAALGSDISVKVEADVKAKDWVLNLFGGYNLRQNE
jgi:hypothetical protein